jgi:hypothetical protein
MSKETISNAWQEDLDLAEERKKELAEECGLCECGKDDEGNQEFIGTDSEWRKFNNLS